MIHRRSFLTGLGALIAAPAIVRVSSLMPVRSLDAAAPSITSTLEYSADGEVWHQSARAAEMDLLCFGRCFTRVRFTKVAPAQVWQASLFVPADGDALWEVTNVTPKP